MTPTIGSLCSGYGGLDLAAEFTFGAQTIWHADPAPGPRLILSQRWPGIPNHGDLTRINWTDIEAPDILTAGYPCQPFALSGRRKGTNDDRHLWPHIREAIRHLRPAITILENVAGHRSLGFDRVCGDMAEDGLDVRWTSVRADQVGACHARERLFVVITAADTDRPRPQRHPASASGRRRLDARDCEAAAHAVGEEQPRWAGLCADETGTLWGPRSGDPVGDPGFDWGEFQHAVDRWAAVLDRPAPRPLIAGPRGGRVLNPRFDEWMMGLPEGWVDVQGMTPPMQIEACGNGVVPQQAVYAIRELVGVSTLTAVGPCA